MHQFSEGVVEKIIKHIFSSITVPGQQLMNDVSKYLSTRWYRQSNRNLPDIHIFKNGLDKTSLTADELNAELYMIYLVLIQTYTITKLPSIESTSSARSKITKKKCDINISNDDNSSRSNELFPNNDSNSSSKKQKFMEEVRTEFPKFAQTLSKLKRWITFIEFTLCLWQWL